MRSDRVTRAAWNGLVAFEFQSWIAPALVALLAATVIFLRCPSSILNPHFYAEDGHVWFADVYNQGLWKPLFRSQDGYFQTVARLTAFGASFFPVVWAPLLFNIVGLVIQFSPICVILSRRMANWGPLLFRSVLALTYVCLPNANELHAQITEAQWHLALLACLLILAEAPRSRAGNIIDSFVFLLCGVSGPFCFLLLPIAMLSYASTRDRSRLLSICIIALTSSLQMSALVFTDRIDRKHGMTLGASFVGLVRIVGGQIYLATLFGGKAFGVLYKLRRLYPVAVGGTSMLLFCCWKGRREMRLFTLFSVLILLASLRNPAGASGLDTFWMRLASTANIRYWFFPALVVVWWIVWSVLGPGSTRSTQVCGCVFAIALLSGIRKDFRVTKIDGFADTQSLQELAKRPRGSDYVFPIYPKGWTVRLRVK